MKKMKLFLLAAMIVGAASAFTTTKTTNDGLWVKGPSGEARPHDYAVNILGGSCNSEISEPYCVFEDEALTIGVPEYGSGRFTY